MMIFDKGCPVDLINADISVSILAFNYLKITYVSGVYYGVASLLSQYNLNNR